MTDSITRREAAKIVGCHVDTLSRLLSGPLAGAVIERKGRGGALRLSRAAVEVYAAAQREARPLDPQLERARRDKAQRLLAEQEYKKRSGELLPADDVARAWSAQVAAVRTKLLAWPAVLADRLLHVVPRGISAVERELADAVREVLTELSEGNMQPAAAPPATATSRRRRRSKRAAKGAAGKKKAAAAKKKGRSR